MKYAIVVDAGSSGSRSFVYTWPDVNNYRETLNPDSFLRQSLIPIETTQLWVNKVQPGISSFHGNVSHIWKRHLYPLLVKVRDIVPREQHAETPIYFLATAGLRLLDEPDRNQILDEVCRLLKKRTNFLLPECSTHVTMIDGQTEGLYGWLGLNYLIHWSLAKNWHNFDDTYGFLDMGGASAQLAYAPSSETQHKNDLHTVRLRNVNGEPVEWNVFVTTWLGFGANQARQKFRDQLVAELSVEELTEYETQGVPIPVSDPCLPVGSLDNALTSSGKRCIFRGSGAWEDCERRVSALLNDGVPCDDEPCLFDGVHVPDFDLKDGKYVGVSEYWYIFQDLFKHNGRFDYEALEPQISGFCSSEWHDIKLKLDDGEYSRQDGQPLTEDDIRKACFKSAWVLTILNKGFRFPLTPNKGALEHEFQDTFQSAMEIEGTEISWTLGRAVLYASAQIPPSAGFEDQHVGITTLDGQFIDGGDGSVSAAMAAAADAAAADAASANAADAAAGDGFSAADDIDLKLNASSSHSTSFVLFWGLLLLALLAAIIYKNWGHQLSKTRTGRKIKKFLYTWLPSVERHFNERTASTIGYGNSYPHAGIPLSNLDIREEGVSTSRLPMRAPSRVGSVMNLTGHED